MISVVVPIYNVEDYIAECLESILAQTYKDIEIICVDDCTLDNSVTIVKEYAKKDKRIRIIRHDENRGLGGARNTGIDNAKGEYICFIDSDDVIEPDMLEEMYRAISNNDVDAVVCGIRRFSGENTLEIATGFHYLKKCETRVYEITSDNKSELVNMWPSAPNKLYKISIIKENECFFPERLLYEDHFFYYNYFFSIRNFYYIAKPFYDYRAAREGSITSGVTGREKEVFTVLSSLKEVFSTNLSKEQAKKCYARVAFRLIWERQFLLWADIAAWLDFCKEGDMFLNQEFDTEFLRKHVDTFVDKMDPFYRYVFSNKFKRGLLIIKLRIKDSKLGFVLLRIRERLRRMRIAC